MTERARPPKSKKVDAERLRSLERQVIQAEKLATLGQLAAGVVHELNNPLTSISVYGSHLKQVLERIGSAADVEHARKVVEAAARIQKLTRDLMSYARPAGELEWVDLNETVRQALVFCDHLIARRSISLSLRLAERLPNVRAIPTQLHQVLINLVTNAVHALPPAGGEIAVATERGDGDELRLCVSDNGIGIDPNNQARVFEPFFTTKTEGQGTGLGLSTVKNIIDGHGGQISFTSRVAHGTTFVVTLPIEKEQSPGMKSA